MKPKILLVTTVLWPSAARLAGAFAVLGARVEAVFPRRHVLGRCRYLARAWRYRPLNPYVSLTEALRHAAPDRVIPCDDRALALLLDLPEFAPLLTRSLGPLENIRLLTTRAPSIAVAREEGISAPLTLQVSKLADLPEALQAVGLPCVMKIDASWGGDGVKFVASSAEAERAFVKLQGPPARLRSLYRALKRRDLHFVGQALEPHSATVNVQALVPGTPATSVFAAHEGAILAAQHMNVLSWSGETGPASLIERVSSPEMDVAARKLAARFGLSGLYGLDFVRDPHGVPHLIEVNPRATQICHLPLDDDLPAALLGLPRRDSVTRARRISLFPQNISGPEPAQGVFQDIPWDDPGVLRAAAGDRLPEAVELEYIVEFVRSHRPASILRRTVETIADN